MRCLRITLSVVLKPSSLREKWPNNACCLRTSSQNVQFKCSISFEFIIGKSNRFRTFSFTWRKTRDGESFFSWPLACSSSGESFTPVWIPGHESWIWFNARGARERRDWLAPADPSGANKPWWRQHAAAYICARPSRSHNITDLQVNDCNWCMCMR